MKRRWRELCDWFVEPWLSPRDWLIVTIAVAVGTASMSVTLWFPFMPLFLQQIGASGDADAALASAQRAYSRQRSSPVAALALAMALARLGRDGELAAGLLDKAERVGGTDALIKETRAQLRR